MPYSITTKDGITLQNIPDDVSQDSPELKARVQAIRGGGAKPVSMDPTEGMSTFDKLAAGAGKAMVDTARGVGQWFGAVSRDDIEESRRLDAPLMKTTAGKVGNIGGSLAMLAPTAMIPGANTMAGATALGAIFGAAQPSTSTGETIANIGLGGAGGAGGQAIANKLARFGSAGSQTTAAQKQLQQQADALGFRLTPGQATGSKSLQKVESALEANPMTSRPFDMLKEGNQRSLNTIAAKSLGETADNLGSTVLGQAQRRMGSVFDKVADATPVSLDPMKIGPRVRQVLDDSEGMIGGNGSLADNALFKRLDEFVSTSGGATREQLRGLSSKFGKAAQNNMTSQNGDRALGEALFGLKEIVDDQVLGTLTGAARKEFADTLKQYRSLMQITARTGTVNPSNGNVSGRGLANLLQQKDKGGFVFGNNQSDLYSAARMAQAFPDVVGNSGTATRSMGAADWLASLPMSVASRAYLSAPSQAAFRNASGGTSALAGLLGKPSVMLPGSVLSGTSGAGLLAPYFGQ